MTPNPRRSKIIFTNKRITLNYFEHVFSHVRSRKYRYSGVKSRIPEKSTKVKQQVFVLQYFPPKHFDMVTLHRRQQDSRTCDCVAVLLRCVCSPWCSSCGVCAVCAVCAVPGAAAVVWDTTVSSSGSHRDVFSIMVSIQSSSAEPSDQRVSVCDLSSSSLCRSVSWPFIRDRGTKMLSDTQKHNYTTLTDV